MRHFEDIYNTACMHKGGEKELNALLPKSKSKASLKKVPDDRYLSNMSLRIFRAGLKHDMVDKKWPAFEEVFKQFDPFYCAMLSDDDIEMLLGEKRIIRHLGKIKSVRDNAYFIRAVAEEYGSFGAFIADWPEDDIVGLWLKLKKQGKQLGGNSGPYFLRMMGKDTFLLTKDVVKVLMLERVVDKAPSAQKDMYAAQSAFMTWKEQSGRSLAEISRIVSCSVG